MILDTRNNTTLQEVERVSLVIRPMTDKGYRGYFLHLYVSFEINHTLPFEDPHYLGKPGNPMLAVLLVFESRWDAPNAPEITEGDISLARHESMACGMSRFQAPSPGTNR